MKTFEYLIMTDTRARWRKNLYSNAGYKDNYTDVSFLANLKTNVNRKRVSFVEALSGAGMITEQVTIVAVFYAVYHNIAAQIFSTEYILLYSSIASGICYCIHYIIAPIDKKSALNIHAKILVIFFVLGYLLAPVLKTLTETISSDTIDATTIVMMLVHLIFYEYEVCAAISSRALSLNAAIFASLCLASRVHSSFEAFVLLTISAECFVLYPTFASTVGNQLRSSPLFCLIAVAVSLMIVSLAYKMLFFYLLLIFFINIICPILFIHWQEKKVNIYGPWDEAIIETKNVM